MTGFAKGFRGVQAAIDKCNRYWGKQEIFHVNVLGIQRQNFFKWGSAGSLSLSLPSLPLPVIPVI